MNRWKLKYFILNKMQKKAKGGGDCMTRWNSLSREQAKQLGLEGEYELMKMEQEETKKTARKKKTTRECPTEYEEQIKLAEYLDMKNYVWCHVPNGGNRDIVTGAKMKKQGVKPGVPDNFIFNLPKKYPNYKGVVIELKRQQGGRVRKSQKRWLRKLNKLGWITKVAQGADEAIDFLEHLE
jgi:hypothetical protein